MKFERYGIKKDFEHEVMREIESAEHRLGRGDADNYASYLAAVKQIQAYRSCLRLFGEVYRRYLEEDEKDDLGSD